MAEYIYSNEIENRFWLQIIGDNTIIISNKLPSKGLEVEQAKQYTNLLDVLLTRARQNLPADELLKLNREAFAAVQQVRNFILALLREQLTKGTVTFLAPVYINNMVNYIDEYLYLLDAFINNKILKFIPIGADFFWLPILYSDAKFIHDNSGIFRLEIRQKADTLAINFSDLYQLATVVRGKYRIGTTDFPAGDEYRRNIRDIVESFAVFTVDMIGLIRVNRLPGTLTLLDLDNLYRRLCYYMTQLNITVNVPKPACNPESPRLSII